MHKYKFNEEHIHYGKEHLVTVQLAYDETLWIPLTPEDTDIEGVMVRIHDADGKVEYSVDLLEFLIAWYEEGLFIPGIYRNGQFDNIHAEFLEFAKRTSYAIPEKWLVN
jgi:hypothetical protein